MSLVDKELTIENDKTINIKIENLSSNQTKKLNLIFTTGVICKLYNRNFIGIEKNIEYFALAKKRLDDNHG